MPQETAFLTDYAVLWPNIGYGNNGEVLLGTAVEIRCRWESGRRDALSPDGIVIAVDALVIVKQAIAVGSVIWRGRLADKANATGLAEVKIYNEVPDLKGRDVYREVMVILKNDSAPS